MEKFSCKFVISLVSACIFLPHIYSDYSSEPSISSWTRNLVFPSKTTLRIELKTQVGLTPYTDVILSLPTECELSENRKLNFNELTAIWLSKLYPAIYSGSGVPLYKRWKRELRVPKRNTTSHYLDHPWGERASIFPNILKLLDSVGVDGKTCLLRAICEMHEDSLESYGLFGEVLLLIFSTSKSPLGKTPILRDFLRAERLGRNKTCEHYRKKCTTSIFQWTRIFNGSASTL